MDASSLIEEGSGIFAPFLKASGSREFESEWKLLFLEYAVWSELVFEKFLNLNIYSVLQPWIYVGTKISSIFG